MRWLKYSSLADEKYPDCYLAILQLFVCPSVGQQAQGGAEGV